MFPGFSKRFLVVSTALVVALSALKATRVVCFDSFCLSVVRAEDQIDALQKQIDELAKLKKLSEDATSPLEKEVRTLESRINSARAGIAAAQKKSEELARTIDEREKTLGYTYQLFSARVAEHYRTATQSNPFLIFLAGSSAGDITRSLAYHERAQSRDEQELRRLSSEIATFEADKKRHEETKIKLAQLQKSLDSSASFFKNEISKAKAYQKDLAGKIANLSAEQQKILAERSSTATTSVGDVPLADDAASRPTYNPGFSPAFAVFSFGAPHFKGMSQYGAYGRAKTGQNEEQILKAYYGNIRIETVDTGGDIKTTSGTMNFEDRYLMGIAEMPSGWDANNLAALKAQAIAARTYALNSVGWRMGSRSMAGTICTTESCQVWNSGKSTNTPENWRRAVQETKGKVIVSNSSNDIFSTMYASTAGGYILSYTTAGHTTPGFWDTTSDWTKWAEGAYEGNGKGASPWFYKAWYKSRSGDSCGRSHPWLTESEFADVLNAWVVRYKGSGGDVERVTPLGSCNGGNPFSMDEMKNKANELGGAFTSVSSVRIEHGNDGYTKSVVVQTNRGEIRVPGPEFKTAFNLRAPGRISVKGNLFGIERK